MTPRREFRTLATSGRGPTSRFVLGNLGGPVSRPPSEPSPLSRDIAMLPPVGASPAPPTGPGSSDSYAIVNRPTLFPLAVSAASGSGVPSSVATSTFNADPFNLVATSPDVFLQLECNRLTEQMTELYYRRASAARAVTALTGLPVPALPHFLGGPPPPGAPSGSQ